METKRRTWRKVLASFAVGGVILSGLAMGGVSLSGDIPVVTDASAGVSGGGGGGSGGGGGGGSARWLEMHRSKMYNGTIRNMPGEINSAVCQNAQRYFVLVPNVVSDARAYQEGWTFHLYGVRNLNGVNFPGGSTVASAIAGNVGWSYGDAANYMFQKNMICLDNPNVINDSQWNYEVRVTTANDGLDESAIYSRDIRVDPQVIEGKLGPIGEKGNLEIQAAVVKRTSFADAYDQFDRERSVPGVDIRALIAKFKPIFSAAKEKDKTAAKPVLTLSEKNQAGLAQGGVLNIYENQLSARATASATTSRFQVWRCGYVHYSQTGWQPSSANNCGMVSGTIDPNNLPAAGLNRGAWNSPADRARYQPTTPGATSWENVVSSSDAKRDTQPQTGFWQILSVHCNDVELAALRAAMPDLVPLDSGDATGKISGLLRTKYYTQQPTQVPLGNSHPSLPAAQRATGTVGFFDKECPFDCTPSRNLGDGASATNGAIYNKANDGHADAPKGLYGSVSEAVVNSSYTEIFRDNVPRTIRPDVWYPVSTDATRAQGIDYNGEAPKTTLVTRLASGTPALETEFNAYGLSGDTKTKLFSTNGDQVNQKNFDAAGAFSSPTAGQVPGLLDAILVQSTWASDSGKPQVLQVAWEYSPSVTSRVPGAISFTPGGANIEISSWVNRTTNVDGRCWGNFGTVTQTAAEKTLATNDIRSNTGSNETTNFGVNNGSIDNSRNLVINFIRGTAE